ITAKQGSALSATAYTAISSTIKSSGIEDRDTSTLAQHKGSTSSAWFDTGAANHETGVTNLDGGGTSWARPGDNDSYDANLTTRSSSYSNIN
ncbi:unnamed protein product, partial [Rotaria socialis]